MHGRWKLGIDSHLGCDWAHWLPHLWDLYGINLLYIIKYVPLVGVWLSQKGLQPIDLNKCQAAKFAGWTSTPTHTLKPASRHVDWTRYTTVVNELMGIITLSKSKADTCRLGCMAGKHLPPNECMHHRHQSGCCCGRVSRWGKQLQNICKSTCAPSTKEIMEHLG